MVKGLVLVLPVVFLFGFQHQNDHVIDSDISLFWQAYDNIRQSADPLEQKRILVEEYFDKGSVGLKGIRAARNYTADEYLQAIRDYPKFWESIRENTLKSEKLSSELEQGIEKLKNIYPEMRPAKIYFTIGVLRTGGTILDGNVLIGSEVAMADKHTQSDEFPEHLQGLAKYFDQNPIDDIVLLNVHEYVHIQQKPYANHLLSMVLYEGIAEFVSVKAMGVPSATPAVAFGKRTPAVRQAFEQTMYYMNNRNQWLWSHAKNPFGVRDLGYYIGYQIAENYYEKAKDKQAAIKYLIELDFSDESLINQFVDNTGFFSKSLNELYQEFEARRPTVIAVGPFNNGSDQVDSRLDQIQLTFSKPMQKGFRNFDYGPLGEDGLIKFKEEIGYSEDGKTYSFHIQKLEPGKPYQLLIGSGFQDVDGVPLKPFLIDFKTKQ